VLKSLNQLELGIDDGEIAIHTRLDKNSSHKMPFNSVSTITVLSNLAGNVNQFIALPEIILKYGSPVFHLVEVESILPVPDEIPLYTNII